MEADDVAEVARGDVTIHQAEGVLAGTLDVPIDEAILSLALRAQFAGVSLAEAGQQVLDDHERRIHAVSPPEIGDHALAILRMHLDRAGSPLEGPSR